MSRVAVWGATGFIGRHLVDALLERGYSTRALCRRPESLPPRWRGRVDGSALEFGAPAGAMRDAVRDCEHVFHCVGHARDEDAFAAFEHSVTELCRAAAAGGVKRVFVLSSVAVYGIGGARVVGVDAPLQSRTTYGQSRIRAEQRVHEAVAGSAASAIVVRIPAVVGVGMPGTMLTRFFRAIRGGCFIHPGRADAVLNCIGVHRLADCLSRLPEIASLPRTCQFADNISWMQLAERYGEAARRRILCIPVPGFALIPVLRALGMVDYTHALEVLDNRVLYEDDAQRLGIMADHGAPRTIDDVRAVIDHCLGAGGSIVQP